MGKPLIYIPVRTENLNYCSAFLQSHGVKVIYTPSSEVTHLMLPAPAFQQDSKLTDGQDLQELLCNIPRTVTVIGGNLNAPSLDGYRLFDLLRNEDYLAKNAAITAECALRIAMQELSVILAEAPVLILGWGRIGKCLAKLLYGLGCNVSIAARKEADLAVISALGFHAVPYLSIASQFSTCRILFNTVPAEILPAHIAENFPANCKKIDLASSPGIGGNNVLWARGLPGKMAPESSGRLIGKTILNYLSQEEASL